MRGQLPGHYSDNSNPRLGTALGFVRSAQGTITSLDPNITEPTLCSPPPSGPQVYPTSINRDGVITGYCYVYPLGRMAQGWIRYPFAPEFAYVANAFLPDGSVGDNVSGYTINQTTGALTAISGSPFANG